MEFSKPLSSLYSKLSILFINQRLNNVKLAFSSCDLCGNSCQKHTLLCQYCENDLPLFKRSIVGYDLLQWPAIEKLLTPHKFDHLFCLSPYTWPFDLWISQLKYFHRVEIASLLANLLSTHWQLSKFGESQNNLAVPQVISVPLHIKKWQQRGFNQAHLIAKEFAKKQHYSYLPELIIRRKVTESQVGKTGKERRKNLTNAFEINTDRAHELSEHIILVDDVVTTGTTANEVCKLLRKRGVQKITLLSPCLALPISDSI